MSVDQNKFKGLSGAWLLKPIFFEMTDSDKSRVLYTLKPQDHTFNGITYPSLRRLYLEEADPTEYYFAEKYFGGWPHWKRLLSCSWFLDYFSEIREELAAKTAADALREIREVAKDSKNRGQLQANRLLLDSAKEKSSVGRPTKDKIRQAAEKMFHDSSDISDDLDRIKASLDQQVYG